MLARPAAALGRHAPLAPGGADRLVDLAQEAAAVEGQLPESLEPGSPLSVMLTWSIAFPSSEIGDAGLVMSWMFALALKFARIGHVAVAFVVHGTMGAALHEPMFPLESA